MLCICDTFIMLQTRLLGKHAFRMFALWKKSFHSFNSLPLKCHKAARERSFGTRFSSAAICLGDFSFHFDSLKQGREIHQFRVTLDLTGLQLSHCNVPNLNMKGRSFTHKEIEAAMSYLMFFVKRIKYF